MGNFQKGGSRGGFKGGDRSGNSRGGSDFKKKSWGNNAGGDRGPVTLYQATCADCSRKCEVPFMPNGKKPVLCKECFGGDKNDRGGRSDFKDRSPRRDFDQRSSHAFSNPSQPTDDLQKSIKELNTKIDTLISLFETYLKNN